MSAPTPKMGPWVNRRGPGAPGSQRPERRTLGARIGKNRRETKRKWRRFCERVNTDSQYPEPDTDPLPDDIEHDQTQDDDDEEYMEYDQAQDDASDPEHHLEPGSESAIDASGAGSCSSGAMASDIGIAEPADESEETEVEVEYELELSPRPWPVEATDDEQDQEPKDESESYDLVDDGPLPDSVGLPEDDSKVLTDTESSSMEEVAVDESSMEEVAVETESEEPQISRQSLELAYVLARGYQNRR